MMSSVVFSVVAWLKLVLMIFVCPFHRATCQHTAQHHSNDSTNSLFSPEPPVLNATFIFPTNATTSIAVVNNRSTTQSITDDTPLTTDPTLYPFTLLDTLITNNQSGLTSAKTNFSNPTYSLATSTPNGTFLDGNVVLPTVATKEAMTTPAAGCLCDLTPDFCDIGCCCDVMDCSLLNRSSVFDSCGEDAGSRICLESWLMFKAQIDPALITLPGNLFCVQREEEDQSAVQTFPAPFQPKSFYPLLQRELTAFNSKSNKFYKVDDLILTYYDHTSILSALSQPSPSSASSTCINQNPARFLRSSSLSCSRSITARSCVDDNGLNAVTYYSGFSLLRVPWAEVENTPEMFIPISNMGDWPEPYEQNGSCLNVVSKVEYVITYTRKGEITNATLNIELLNTTIDTQLLQKHAVTFQLDTPTPPVASTSSSPSDGLKPESPLVGWFGEKAQPLTVLGMYENGECSAGLTNRTPILFKQNIITGCTFRSLSSDCGVLQAELLGLLVGIAVPDLISMTGGSQNELSRVISQDCSIPTVEACETGCLLPVSLSVQVLWAQRGMRALSQNHILGAKFIFGCEKLRCPLLSSVPVTTEVRFSDATVYPGAPWGEPQPEWKFPFAFFSRGLETFDQE